jgi:hypothetical protein
MKKNIVYIAFFALFCISCNKVIIIGTNYKNIPQKYSFKLPKGAKVYKIVSDDSFMEYKIIFPGNKILFISNNDIDGCSINDYKYDVYGKNVNMKFLTSDTLQLSGKNNLGYWKEIKKDGLVYGYLNLHENEIIKFESILASKKLK